MVLSCGVIIWDANTTLFYFSWKLHSLKFLLILGRVKRRNSDRDSLTVQCVFQWYIFSQCSVVSTKDPKYTRQAPPPPPSHMHTHVRSTLQRKSPLYFPFLGMARPQPQFNIHVSVSDLYSPRIGLCISSSRVGRPIMGIYKSLTDA